MGNVAVHEQTLACDVSPLRAGIKADPDVFISHTSLSKPFSATNQKHKGESNPFKKEKPLLYTADFASFILVKGFDSNLKLAGLKLYLKKKTTKKQSIFLQGI